MRQRVGLLICGIILGCWGCKEENKDKEDNRVTCSNVGEPCGGDIVGSWNLAESCGVWTTESPWIEGVEACNDSPITTTTEITGFDSTYNDDNTFQEVVHGWCTLDATLSEGCFDAVSGGRLGTFVDYCTELAAESKITCSVTDSTCACSDAGACDIVDIKGTYTISETTLTTTVEDDNGDDEVTKVEYCVANDQHTQWVGDFAIVSNRK